MFPRPKRLHGDEGQATIEYALVALAAAALAAVLYGVVTGEPVLAALTGLIESALAVNL